MPSKRPAPHVNRSSTRARSQRPAAAAPVAGCNWAASPPRQTQLRDQPRGRRLPAPLLDGRALDFGRDWLGREELGFGRLVFAFGRVELGFGVLGRDWVRDG